MDRWACVSVDALPLQLLLRRQPAWAGLPAVVVSEDKPQGTVLWANETARKAGALPGQSYAVALSLANGLRAGVVSEADVSLAKHGLKELLWKFSPHVEVGDEHGVFWLDASGLGGLYPSLLRWAEELRTSLQNQGWTSHVVVGFSRFGTYAVARAGRGKQVLRDPAEEQRALGRVSLVNLDLPPELRDVLAKLGVHTVDALLRLPSLGLLTRFGRQAQRLHALARGELFSPLAETPWEPPLSAHTFLDEAESDTPRLLFVIKRLLDGLLAQLAMRGQALSGLTLSCKLDRKQGELGPETLRPSVPTLDVVQLMDLVRLRLESGELTGRVSSGVIEVQLEVAGVPTGSEQLRVFAEQPRRDLVAGARALARLRAELGEHAVVRAVLCAGHLPEARFAFQPIDDVRAPRVTNRGQGLHVSPSSPESSVRASLARRPLVRRIFSHPEALCAPPRHPRDDGWLIRGAVSGPVTHMAGPYVVSGGWWVRQVDREYHMVLTRRGDLLWVYHDRRRRRIFLHGEVQ